MADKYESKFSGAEVDELLSQVAPHDKSIQSLTKEVESHKTSKILDHPDNSVTTEKIADEAITKDKIAKDVKDEIDAKAGFKTANGGEIFNDYENNQAISDKTTASGTNTLAGCKGFYWYDIDFSSEQPAITLTDQRLSPPSSEISTGYAVGDVISIVNDAKYIDCATITAIGDNTITVDALPFTEVVDMSNDLNFDDYTLCVLEKPTLGTVDLGIGANASGVETKALGAYSNVKGKGNIGKGQYSDIGGRDNEGGYCAHIGGRENKGGSYDLIGGYKNNSDGGANVIGGVGNLNDDDNNIMGGRDNINHGKNNVIGGAENLINKGHHFIGMFGRGHISSALYQLFGGSWSKATANTLFAIGNGTGDTKRNNAFEVLKDGRAVLGAEPTSDMGAVNKSFLEKIINALNFKNGKGTGSICLPSTKSSKGAYTFTSGYENVNDEQNAIVGGRNNENYGKNNIMSGAENIFQKGHHFGAMFGRGHISTALYQLFSGSWSNPSADTLLAVGNGTSDENRSNALEVHKDGRATLGAAPVNDMDAVNKKYVDDLSNDKFKELAIKAEASGVDINITDAAQMPLESLNIYGKTNQVHTTGKNLFAFTEAKTITASGLTMTTSINNSYFDISGRATGVFSSEVLSCELPAGTYTMSMYGLVGTEDYVYLKNKNTNTISVGTLKNGKAKSFTITETTSFAVAPVIRNTTPYAYNNTPVYIQIEQGDTATDYEPYTNGIASPSPECPQPMETIGSYGAIKFEVNTKNLFWFKEGFNTTSFGITASADAGGSVIKVNGKATSNAFFGMDIGSLPAGTYTLSVSSALGNADYMFLKNKDSDVYFVPSIKKGQSATFTLTKNTNLRTGLVILTASDYTYTNAEVYLQIEKGQTATNYEPSKNQILEIGDEYTFAGIPVTSNGNYTDENGQQWVCDEIDFEKGVYVQRIKEITIPEFENVDIITNNSGDEIYLGVALISERTDVQAALCAVAKYSRNSGSNTLNSNEFILVDDVGGTYIEIVAFAESEDEFRNKFEGEKMLVAFYEPIETQLSDEQVSLYKSIYTNKPITHIFNDANAHVKVGYVADTKTYIDNKINTLIAAIITE